MNTALQPEVDPDVKVLQCSWELMSLSQQQLTPSVDNLIEIMKACNTYGEQIIVLEQRPYEDALFSAQAQAAGRTLDVYPAGRFSFEWFIEFGDYTAAKAIYDMNNDKLDAAMNPMLKCFVDKAAAMTIAVNNRAVDSSCWLIEELPESFIYILRMIVLFIPF